jgi:ABC-type sugar transport system substrate-binding protein
MIRSTVSCAAALGASLALAASAMAASPHVTMAQAKREILGDGYTALANVHRTKAGWEAHAMESGKPVTVLVTPQGDVEKTQ